MNLLRRIARNSVSAMLRAACVLGIAAITLMLASVLFPRPLVVISAMSIGHALGISAFAFYLIAILLDTARASKPRSDVSGS